MCSLFHLNARKADGYSLRGRRFGETESVCHVHVSDGNSLRQAAAQAAQAAQQTEQTAQTLERTAFPKDFRTFLTDFLILQALLMLGL
jgi:hypothetical protein